MKLFLTGDDDVAAALGFEKLEHGERSSGVKEVRCYYDRKRCIR